MRSMSLRFNFCIFLSISDRLLAHPASYSKLQGRQVSGGLLDSAASIGIDIDGEGEKDVHCWSYQIISARGTGENQTHPETSAGFISGVLSTIPSGTNYEVQYPANVAYLTSPPQGVFDALNHISSQQSNCPQQLYVLMGYSEGAMVMTQLLNSASVPSSLIAAVVLYGNPYFIGGALQDACSAKTGHGVAVALGVLMPARYSNITFDCCVVGDMVCQVDGSFMAHRSYAGSESEKAAVKFAISKLTVALDGTNTSEP